MPDSSPAEFTRPDNVLLFPTIANRNCENCVHVALLTSGIACWLFLETIADPWYAIECPEYTEE